MVAAQLAARKTAAADDSPSYIRYANSFHSLVKVFAN
jgi:hypothetical protein